VDEASSVRVTSALSAAQEQMWFFARLDPHVATYNSAVAFRLRGELDRDALSRAVALLPVRHAALRTRFATDGDEPVQIVEPSATLAVDYHDLSPSDEGAQARERDRILESAARRPFDLERPPLARVDVVSAGSRDHVVLITIHHIVSDARSYDRVMRDLAAMYNRLRAGGEVASEPDDGRYARRCEAERRLRDDAALAREESFWRGYLDGAPAVSRFPADLARSDEHVFAGAHHDFAIAPAVAGALRALGRREETSLFTVLMTAYAVLLARFSGQSDVVFGVPVSTRADSGEDDMAGLFVNTIPVRAELGGDPAFREALARVRESAARALEHKRFPFAKILEAVRPPRDAGRHPVYQSVFNYRALDYAGAGWAGLEVSTYPWPFSGRSMFATSLNLERDGEGVRCRFEYATSSYDARTIERLAYGFQALLARVAADANARAGEIALLSGDERRRVLIEWNATERAYPDRCLHELVEARAAERPEAVALVHDGARLGYAELNARANRLAHWLRSAGVRPESRVALCAERGIELVVAMLAVLKAGGAYVPLDPSYPAERLRYMLEDSAPVVVLIAGVLPAGVERIVRGTPAQVAHLESDAARWAAAPAANPGRGELTTQNLAYVMYTSGSTGRPKGVAIEHRGVANMVAAVRERCAITARERMLQFSSPSFDASVEELFCGLTAGATVILRTEAWLAGPEEFWELSRAHDVSWMELPTLFWEQLARDASPVPACVRQIFFGGEAVSAAALTAWFGRGGPLPELINVYGPTEASVTATLHRVTRDESAWQSIGRPIANTRVYIVDAHGEPQPIGVAGELWIGGAGVARGYLNRPDLTAERFVASPFVAGDRLYKTGDLARYLPDGDIEFLGRDDHQVKVRGYRIELGEIEARLAEHPAVGDAVVLARKDAAGEKSLIAYCTRAGASEVPTEELRAHAAAALPAYMVPQAYVVLAALPVTPNGKVDRDALSAPEAGAYPEIPYEAPAGATETAVARIWSEVLGRERIGRNDDFFELGGHSLLAVRVVSRLRRVLQADVGMVDFFARPVLRDVAVLVEDAPRTAPRAVPVASRTEPPRLSFAQRQLWFLAEMNQSGAYHIPIALRLIGELDRAALRRALDALVARHEALRTTFAVIAGEPVQRIAAPDTGFVLAEDDLRGRPDPAAELEALSAAEAAAPFDLGSGPLIRGRLVALGADEHVLLVTMHHIVADGWSVNVLVRDLTELYRAQRAGAGDPLPPLAVQYADYAAWQRELLSGASLQRLTAYWRDALAGAPVLLDLPLDRPRPALQDHAGATVPLELDAELTAGLKALARRHGVTLFMALIAAWSALLARLSGQDDVVVGTPVANRPRAELEDVVGLFVTMLPLRIDLSGEPTVREMLERVKARALAAQAHQELPFEQVVEIVNPPRSLAHGPLFQAAFAWQDEEQRALDVAGLRFVPAPVPYAVAKFDLTLNLGESDGRIVGGLNFATALFDRETAERYTGYLRRLLTAMVRDDARAVSALPLLTEAERQRIVVEWNATDADYAAGRCVHELVEEQAAKTPDAPAVVHDGDVLTYRELNARANRLARRLRAAGVVPGSRVATLLERSFALVAAELAILKCGAAYVPIDRDAPPERQRFMIEDCAIRIAVTAGAEALPACAELVRISADDDGAHSRGSENLALPADAEATAYVIYTSGSTGRPKGVVVPHRAICRLVVRAGYADFAPADRVAFASNPAFDASTMEVWGPLVAGACIVVIDRDAFLDEGRFARALERERVTALFITTSLFNEYAQRIPEALGRLRFLMSGGEQNSPRAFLNVLRAGPEHLIHCYGPTETTTFAITREITEVPPGTTNLPIGRPIANTRAYILDAHREPVPCGVVGELYLGGPGVANGYHNRPELTAERFVASPFVDGDRLYKTGDLARYLRDGEIELVGRNDFQVKIRGFRIELGEIEARLSSHAAVREVTVVAREEVPGEKRLVAYYTASDAAAASAETLRAHLAASLPEYMVPAAYVRLEAFPLTVNGKLDRKALPAPDDDAYGVRAYEAPLGELETAIAEIWADVLGLERIGRDDDFFELGGHSLVALRVLSRLRVLLGADLALGELFAHPTLREFAQLVAGAARDALPPIEPCDREAPLPLSFAQQRLWFLEQMEGGEAYQVPMGLRLAGELDRPALVRALNRIVSRHEALRTTFGGAHGEPVQRIAPPGAGLTLVEHDLRGRRDAMQELESLAAREATAPFDLETGPLIRGRLVALASDDHALLVTMHHIVSDGWSIGIFIRELSALYAAYHAGEADPLPPPAVQYADYAAWQRRWLSGDALRSQSEYWERALAGAPALLQLPADRPRPARRNQAGAEIPVTLGAQLTADLKALGSRHGTTLFMTIMTAWSIVLARLSGQDDVVVGTPVANRGRSELEELIGFFVNMLPVRTDLSGAPAAGELLQRVKANVLAAQHHQDLPFEQVVEIVKPPRSLAHTPIFQVAFAWQSNEESGFALPGLRAARLDVPYAVAKFDLTLSLGESGDRVEGALAYATALFDRATAERYAAYLREILAGMAADDRRSVGSLNLLPTDEAARVLVEWNAPLTPYAPAACVHELVEAQAAAAPRALAVTSGDARLTYGELNARANRLARYLRAAGAGPERRVAMCAERGLESVIGLLAVLKAGAAYLPLEPSYPAERLRFMLQDGAPVAVLTHGELRAPLRDVLRTVPGSSVPVVDLRLDAERWAAEPDGDLPREGLSPANPAYVIYTSGSTGRPKGVIVEHRHLASTLTAARAELGFGPGDVAANLAPHGFDTSLLELLLPLVSGGSTIVVPADQVGDMTRVVEQTRRATFFGAVASLVEAWLEFLGPAGASARYPSLRYLWSGGEPVSDNLLRRLMSAAPQAEIFGFYGPTEAAITSTFYRAKRHALHPVPHCIGRPFACARAYVLNDSMSPQPPGVPGELYLGGTAVARGYLNRPELTAERFLPSPFVPGERLYRTGDLARTLSDGNIEFLGRNDHQVKIRGFRIELGEIEARLAEHPAVREAVVLARTDAPGETRLVAYYTRTDAPDPGADAMRAHMSAVLPEYMVPAAYVALGAMPTTPNGKLDRTALPAPAGDAYAGNAYAPPVGEVERVIAQIWGDLLRRDRIGRHDDFFDLGGHSLLAVRVLSRVRRVFGVEISLIELFAEPRLRDVARLVTNARRAALPAIPAVRRDEPLRLSSAQQRLWFLAQVDAGNAFHIPMGLRLTGELDRPALIRALDRIVARHEALRTTFTVSDGEPVQHIAPAGSGFALVEQSLAGHPSATAELESIAAHEAAAPFDLRTGPLIRGRLIALGHAEHVLLITMHHVVSDGWSIGLLIRELSALYDAYGRGLGDPLPPLAIQYADYAAWERGWSSGESLREQSAYWERTLAGAPVLQLPTDRPRPVQQDYTGARVALELDAALTQRLVACSQRHGTTLFMTLVTAWAILLARLSGQDDIVVGTPVANRTRAEVEDVIGFFVNMLALRLDLSGDPTVGELLQRVKAQALDAQHNQDLPFEQVVEIAKPPRSLAHPPLFQVMFAWQNNEQEAFALPGLFVASVGIPYHVAQFDLTLNLTEADDRIVGGVEYAAALFDRTTVERYVRYLREILSEIAGDDGRRVSRVRIMPAAERAEVLGALGAGADAHATGRFAHELFEGRVAADPDAVAAIQAGESLSYGELNARANRLAHHLREIGVRPESRVAVCGERGLETLIALLAVLKSGGAYVPLDPSYPGERLRFMIEDCAPAVLLVHGEVPDQVLRCSSAVTRVIDLRAGSGAWAGAPDGDPPQDELRPEHLAYLIYTSGSTGRPKGVMVEHRHLATKLVTTQAELMLSPGDVLPNLAASAFDISLLEMLLPLAAGAATQLVAPDRVVDVARLLEETSAATFFHAVPSLAEAWLDVLGQDAAARYPALRCVLVGGEAVSESLLRRLTAHFPHAKVVELYGPTEAVIVSTFLRANEPRASAPYCIGRTFAGVRAYVLDEALEPQPPGIRGELYLGGAAIARGYWNRPELTAERFVPSPFAGGDRLYKTGDHARYLPDGNLEFLGRSDLQVKVRGFRIELGEVEARLAEHPAIREVVVLAREDVLAEKRLVAYFTPAAQAAPASAETLRAHVLAALPGYMAPSAYVALQAFPLTPNGKLDRSALPAPADAAYGARVYEAPAGEAETAIARIWCDVLGLERVGRHDDFFELGGHSLLVVRVVERMRRAGLHADVRSFFTSPALADLAAAAQGESSLVEVPPNRIPAASETITPEMLPLVRLSAAEIERIVATVPGGAPNVQDIYPLAPLQEGILFHHLLTSEGDPYLLHALYRFDTRERLERYAAALQAVIDRHDVLRTAVVWEQLSEPVQVVWRRAPLVLEEVALDAHAGSALAQLTARFDPRRYRLDVRRAPLIRLVAAYDAAAGDWAVILLLHHLVSDHTALEIVFGEIEAHLLGRAEQLPAPLPFRNFVAQARLGVSREEHATFFREMLGDVDEPTVPFGLSDVQGDGSQDAQARVALGAELSRRLRAQARSLGVSAASLFHTAFARVLGAVSGRDDVVFGTVLFGRMHGGEGADRALGLYMNTLPIRVRLEGGVRESVRRTHASLARLLHHEHASLALAQRYSGVPAPAPLFSAVFNYRHSDGGRTTAAAAWDGIEALDGEERTNYPLTLSADDLSDAFLLTAQTRAPLDPRRVCTLMHTAVQHLVDALEHAPAAPVERLGVLPDDERRRVLVEWNATGVPYPADRGLHELFAEQAARAPDALAVVHDGVALGYGELDARANRLARRLRRLGARSGDRVALLLDRSVELVTAMLAVLKCGAAYVPLDPSTPAERLAFMLQDAGASFALSLSSATVPVPEGVHTIDVDRVPADEDGRDETAARADGASAACVIYTSGSTGWPKGTIVPHRGIARVAIDNGYAEFGPADRVGFGSNPAFDVSSMEVWGPLLNGGCIVVLDRATLLSPERLRETLTRHGVTILWLTSALFVSYADALRDVFPRLRYLLVGGDVVDPSAAARVLRNGAPQKFVNAYGPTEASTFATAFPIALVPDGAAGIPIGRPISNTRVYVLDSHREPVPVGVAGELYIGGPGVALGYVNRPELTAERFVPNPFVEGDRLYKTGDLARYLPDGNLEFLGRNDHQVKVRGFRIELGEIEVRLAAHEAVRDAVVLLREDRPGEKRLVAYYTLAAAAAEPSAEELRAHLAAALPEYMVPAAYVRLDAVPLTLNNKVDRRALPAPDGEAYARRQFEAPAGEIETAIARIWRDVLGVERVGRHDNFFELGGHSLAAVRAIEAMRAAGLHSDVLTQFTAPTLAQLAAAVGTQSRTVDVPPNLIPAGAETITPEMLTLWG
jgi:amino acid adenylation domain-containing protein